jgi:ubiquinone/menaquinone biosynthesis C-methylase UbiE
MDADGFVSSQREHFGSVEAGRFLWQTRNKAIKRLESCLLGDVSSYRGLVLEVGCGEGANIRNLLDGGAECEIIGLDLSLNRVEFARGASDAAFICGDALNMP